MNTEEIAFKNGEIYGSKLSAESLLHKIKTYLEVQAARDDNKVSSAKRAVMLDLLALVKSELWT